MIKLDIINEVVNKTGITKTKAELAVETVFESMRRSLSKGDRIELRGFGVFNVRPRKTGIGRNPRTGAEVSFRLAKRCDSSLAKSCSRSTRIWIVPSSVGPAVRHRSRSRSRQSSPIFSSGDLRGSISEHQSFHVRPRSSTLRPYCRIPASGSLCFAAASAEVLAASSTVCGHNFHHAGGRRENGIRFPAQCAAICPRPRTDSTFPGRLGSSATRALAARGFPSLRRCC